MIPDIPGLASSYPSPKLSQQGTSQDKSLAGYVTIMIF